MSVSSFKPLNPFILPLHSLQNLLLSPHPFETVLEEARIQVLPTSEDDKQDVKPIRGFYRQLTLDEAPPPSLPSSSFLGPISPEECFQPLFLASQHGSHDPVFIGNGYHPFLLCKHPLSSDKTPGVKVTIPMDMHMRIAIQPLRPQRSPAGDWEQVEASVRMSHTSLPHLSPFGVKGTRNRSYRALSPSTDFHDSSGVEVISPADYFGIPQHNADLPTSLAVDSHAVRVKRGAITLPGFSLRNSLADNGTRSSTVSDRWVLERHTSTPHEDDSCNRDIHQHDQPCRTAP